MRRRGGPTAISALISLFAVGPGCIPFLSPVPLDPVGPRGQPLTTSAETAELRGDAFERAYLERLEGRLGRPVPLCASPEEKAAAVVAAFGRIPTGDRVARIREVGDYQKLLYRYPEVSGPALLAGLRDPSASRRALCAETLASTGRVAPERDLRAALLSLWASDPDPAVRAAATLALAESWDDHRTPTADEVLARLEAEPDAEASNALLLLMRRREKDTDRVLAAVLRSKATTGAASDLGWYAYEDRAPELLAALRSLGTGKRRAIAYALSWPTALGPWAVELILLGLSDSDVLVRQGFAWNAAKLSDPSAAVTSRLRDVAAHDPDPEVRAAARWALAPRDPSTGAGPEWPNYLPKRRDGKGVWPSVGAPTPGP